MSLVFYIATQFLNNSMKSILYIYQNVASNSLPEMIDCCRYYSIKTHDIWHQIFTPDRCLVPRKHPTGDKSGDLLDQPFGQSPPIHELGTIHSKENWCHLLWSGELQASGKLHSVELWRFWSDLSVKRFIILDLSYWFLSYVLWICHTSSFQGIKFCYVCAVKLSVEKFSGFTRPDTNVLRGRKSWTMNVTPNRKHQKLNETGDEWHVVHTGWKTEIV